MRIPAEFIQYRDRVRNSNLWNIRLEDMDRDELLAVIGYLCDRAARSALHLAPHDTGSPRPPRR